MMNYVRQKGTGKAVFVTQLSLSCLALSSWKQGWLQQSSWDIWSHEWFTEITFFILSSANKRGWQLPTVQQRTERARLPALLPSISWASSSRLSSPSISWWMCSSVHLSLHHCHRAVTSKQRCTTASSLCADVGFVLRVCCRGHLSIKLTVMAMSGFLISDVNEELLYLELIQSAAAR